MSVEERIAAALTMKERFAWLQPRANEERANVRQS